jgi:hypothetical protein
MNHGDTAARRDDSAQEDHPPVRDLLKSETPVPAWWTSRLEQINGFLDAHVGPQELRTLAASPGGRAIRAVFYGEPEPHLRGRANLNSALGAQDPDAYCRRAERKRPVLMILAGVHGAEVEGMMGALSAISILQTGADIAGNPQPVIAEKLRRLRLIVIPLANPDGRARVPYDGWVGLPGAESNRIGKGTRRDGTPYGWPGCKQVHPMVGDVGLLGAYFDDAGVNLMHDEWGGLMSAATRAILKVVREEAPDVVLNCHSQGPPPAVMRIAYAPQAVKERVAAFAESLYTRFDQVGIAHGPIPEPRIDGPDGTCPPAMNLTGMFFHTGAAMPLTFEAPHGTKDKPVLFTYEQLLQMHHILFENAADWLVDAARP